MHQLLNSQVVRPVDELFDRDELSAAPDTGWPDLFDASVFVMRPSHTTYAQLLALALDSASGCLPHKQRPERTEDRANSPTQNGVCSFTKQYSFCK